MKRRLVLAVATLLLLLGMLAAPISRQYSINNHPCATTDCSGQVLTTDAHYGIPFAWLTLTKSVHHPSQKAAASSVTKDTKKLILNVVSWIFIAGIIVISTRNPGTIKFYANSRH